jgi:exosortase D (VPLPA-CTERM-specific)
MRTYVSFETIWFKVFTLLTLFVAAYWIPLNGIVTTWWTNDDYSYGFLIPLISAYLLWDKRLELKGLQAKGSWIVLPVLIFFVALSVYAILGSSGNISRPLIPILIILFTAFCFGIEAVKRLIFPLGFLVFMVPLPAILDRSVGVFLNSISSKLGGEVVRMVGIPVHVSGNVIDLGVTQLQVVDACSGLRYVFPLVALGMVYAYFFERVAWKRIFCSLATIAIAILTNVLRIGTTGILSNNFGTEVAEGFFHGFSGWTVFMVAFAFLFVFGRFLHLFPPKGSHTTTSGNVASRIGRGNSKVSHARGGKFIVGGLVLLGVGLLTWTTKVLPPVQLKDGIASFPLAFEDWQGYSESVDPNMVIRSGAEEAFSGSYVNSKSEKVSLYLGYRGTAFLENDNFFHSPTVCLPASGWKREGTSMHEIPGVPGFGSLSVTKMIIDRMGAKQLVYFWFQTKSKATHDKNINRLHLALHALQRDNTHDLFIRPITPIKSNEKIEDSQQRLDQFVRDMMGILHKFLKEKYVETR